MLNIKDIFEKRTNYKFSNKPIDKQLLIDIYELMKLGSTSFNSSPLRILFVESETQKEKLYKCLLPSNLDKCKSAPVNTIFAYDTSFFKLMPKLFPARPEVENMFDSSPTMALETAMLNSTLQAAYFMIIAKSKGLDYGPMSGFDQESVNKEFFAGTSLKVSFICNLGYADGDNPHERLPRLSFDECCKFI